jgi:predicted transcriptional regulator
MRQDVGNNSRPGNKLGSKPKIRRVSIRASIKPEYLMCMECGRQQKLLRRYLRTAHGMTPEESEPVRLPESYPMVAPHYSQQRRSRRQ